MNNSRDLDTTMRQLGGDPNRLSLSISDYIQPVYVLDDASFALPNRGNTRFYMTANPSTLAAQFSGVVLSPRLGMWIRRCIPSANCLWGVFAYAFQAVAVDGNPPATHICPEGAPPELWPVGGFGLLSNYVAPQVFLAPLYFPVLFAAGPLSTGVGRFTSPGPIAGFANVSVVNDLWIPPGSSFVITHNTANTGILIQIELDFPADVLQPSIL